MNDWHIQQRAHACQGCNHPFADKQPYHTVLSDAKLDIQRLDLCGNCWTNEAESARDRKGFISHWQGIFEMPPAAPPEAIRKENAETLLRKLVELNDPAHGAATFILAVMLERKRILKVKDQLQRENGRVFIYEHPHTGDIFTIPDPNLQLNQLESVQRHVAELLEHGLSSQPTELEPANPSAVPSTPDSPESLQAPVPDATCQPVAP